MAAGIKRRSFDEGFKRKAVRMLLESEKPISSFAMAIGVERSNLHRWLKRYGSDIRREKQNGPQEPVGLDDFISLKREVEAIKETINHLRSIVKHSLADRYKEEIGPLPPRE